MDDPDVIERLGLGTRPWCPPEEAPAEKPVSIADYATFEKP